MEELPQFKTNIFMFNGLLFNCLFVFRLGGVNLLLLGDSLVSGDGHEFIDIVD